MRAPVLAVRLLPLVLATAAAAATAACGHSPGKGLKPMVDTPILPFKAPDADAIADITGVDADDEAAILAGSGSAGPGGGSATPAPGGH